MDNHHLQLWLELMGRNTECWERIELDENSKIDTLHDLLLSVCSQSDDKILIVANRNGWVRKFKKDEKYVYDGVTFIAFDREQTYKNLEITEDQLRSNIKGVQNCHTTYNLYNSIMADNHSSIYDSNIDNNDR